MKTNNFILFPLFLISTLVLGCTTTFSNQDDIIARVGNERLSFSEVKRLIPSNISQGDSTQYITRYREDWIKRQLLTQEAERVNLQSKPEIQSKIKESKDLVLQQAFQDYFLSQMNEEITVSDIEAQTYYAQNKDDFLLQERYLRYRHVITVSRDKSELAKRDLMRGLEWEDIAKKYTLDSDWAIAHSFKYIKESNAALGLGPLNSYLKVIGVTEISRTEQINNEFHFVQLLEEKAKGEHPDLEWIINEIKGWLIIEKRRRAFNSYVQNLYLQSQANNEIQIFELEK